MQQKFRGMAAVWLERRNSNFFPAIVSHVYTVPHRRKARREHQLAGFQSETRQRIRNYLYIQQADPGPNKLSEMTIPPGNLSLTSRTRFRAVNLSERSARVDMDIPLRALNPA